MKITHARVPGLTGEHTLEITDGRISAITSAPGEKDAVAPRFLAPLTVDGDDIDAAGRLVLHGLINAHAHIDKTLKSGPWISAPQVETVAERIAHERRERDRYNLPRVDFISAMVEMMIAAGTTHIRTHTDVDPGVGIRGIEAVAEVAARYADAVTIEQVAFPQGGLITNPGTEELLRDAVAAGATVIGGLDPAGFDNAPNAHLETIFGLAAELNTGIDIHLHDGGSLGAWEMGLIADLTTSHQLGGKVAISHAFAIDYAPTQAKLLARFAEAGVSLITGAVYNGEVPPVVAMHEAGVGLGAGTDGMNDLWGPYGEDGDMLRRAMMVGYRSELRDDEGLELAFATATTGAAAVIGLDDYGVQVGGPADLVIVAARSIAEAVATVPVRDIVLKRGRIVARGGELVG